MRAALRGNSHGRKSVGNHSPSRKPRPTDLRPWLLHAPLYDRLLLLSPYPSSFNSIPCTKMHQNAPLVANVSTSARQNEPKVNLGDLDRDRKRHASGATGQERERGFVHHS